MATWLGLLATPLHLRKLDAQAKDVICIHLLKAQFFDTEDLKERKIFGIDQRSSMKVFPLRKETRIDILCAKFNRLKRLRNEHVQETFDRLSDISNELSGLSAQDITHHEIVKKLL